MDEPTQNDAATKRERDQRVKQTRSAIVGSLNGLVFERPYEEINVPDILSEAGVGRSTFYEHFRNKDQAILHSATDVLSVMADSIVPGSSRAELIHKLEHFRENRRMVLDLLSGPIGAQMTQRTADLMQQRLEQMCRTKELKLLLAPKLAAAQCAGALLGLVRTWLESLDPIESAALADAIMKSMTSSVSALIAPASSTLE